MINFDAVDFSERRPEEVISFSLLTLSVYYLDVYKLYRLLIATFVHDLINNKLLHNFIDYFTYIC